MKTLRYIAIGILSVGMMCAECCAKTHGNARLAMKEMYENGVSYLRRQLAFSHCFERYGRNGHWDEIGFEPKGCMRDSSSSKDERCQSKYFRYSMVTGIDFPLRGISMSLLDTLEGCPAGAYWETFVHLGRADVREPENEACKRLAPNFKNMLKEIQKFPKSEDAAAQIQPAFGALFKELRRYFSDETVPNFWVETFFRAPVDSALFDAKIAEVGEDKKPSVEANFHETEWFVYEEVPAYMEIQFRRIYTGMRVVSKRRLGKCPIGSIWEGYVVADIQDMNHIGKNLCTIIKEPSDERCRSLTPRIHDLHTCNTKQWMAELDAYRAQMLVHHRDSVKRHIELHNASVEKEWEEGKKKRQDEMNECMKTGKTEEECFIFPFISFKPKIDEFYYTTPLNIWDVFTRGKSK